MTRFGALLAVAFLAFGAMSLAGCHACEDLTEKICADLGPEDCKLYKEGGLAEKMLPSTAGRGRNKACSAMASEPAYSGVLTGAKQAVAAQKAAEAAAAKAKK